jgi:predicted enzyme related to lactoylglutathione lyase
MDTKAKLIGAAPQLAVNDVVRTTEYYMHVLGFKLIGYFMEPPVYAMVERDGFQVHFGKSDSGLTKYNNAIRQGMTDFIIWVPEIESFYDEVKANNAEIIQEITQRVYGREFIIADCDGHRILVCD